MTTTIIYDHFKILLSQSEEDTLEKLIGLAFKAYDVVNNAFPFHKFRDNLDKIAELGRATVTLAFEKHKKDLTQEQYYEYIKLYDSDNFSRIIAATLNAYQLTDYDDSYLEFINCLHLMFGLGAIGTEIARGHVDVLEYSREFDRLMPFYYKVYAVERIYRQQIETGV